jgi:hypothetical protein
LNCFCCTSPSSSSSEFMALSQARKHFELSNRCGSGRTSPGEESSSVYRLFKTSS